MRPLAVFTGILLGSFFSITVSLAAVMLVFLILEDDYPRLAHEFNALLSNALIFMVLTVISAASFYSLLKQHKSRRWLQGGLWSAIAAATGYYWPAA